MRIYVYIHTDTDVRNTERDIEKAINMELEIDMEIEIESFGIILRNQAHVVDSLAAHTRGAHVRLQKQGETP